MKRFVSVIILFLLLVTLMTFPLVFKINTHIPGFFSSDENLAPLWDSWRIKYSVTQRLPLRFIYLISYPFGVDLYSSGFVSYLWSGLLYLLSLLTTPVLTYNLQVLTNIFLSAVFTYFLVFYLIKNRLTAVLSGIIFAFCPFQFIRSWQHITITYNQWIPLVLLAAISLKEKQDKKKMFLFSLSAVLLLSFDYSIMYLGVITLLVFILYTFFYKLRIRIPTHRETLFSDLQYLKSLFISGALSLILLMPQFLPVIINRFRITPKTAASVFNPYHRPFEDLFSQSAKPLSYLLPAVVHPIFGKFTENFIGSQLYGMSFTEHTLYLGWVPLILAFIAFRRWKKERRKAKKLGTVPFGDSPYNENFYIGFFIFLAIAAWLFSQPPWWKIGPAKIYMPSFFMYKVLPMYRAYCRFGIVVMLAIAVLAGFGLKFILEKFRTQKAKIAITVLFCALVLFEFWNWPPYKVIDVSKVPAVYYWLKEQPEDIVIAEYPLDADSPNEMYKFFQTVHEKKIINGTIPGTDVNRFAQTIRNLSNPDTPSKLKWMGVKYVLVHRAGYLETELIEDREELERIPKNPGLKFIQAFPAQECPRKDIMCVQKTGPIDAYEVIAPPKEPQP